MVSRPLLMLAEVVPQGLPLTGRVVRAGLARAFGPPPFDPAAAPGDPGLFGPGSASWQVISEPAAIVGGIRALLVQSLHPLAMAGVAKHSRFREDALSRLQRTSAYVTATTFGSTPEALTAAATVRKVHRRVRGTAPDGRPYTADDPQLLAWVSIALTSSFLATDGCYAATAVDAATADAFVAEQSRAAALLDRRVDLAALGSDEESLQRLREGRLDLPMLSDAILPSTVAQLRERLEDFRPHLDVNHQGRRALRFLLWPDVPGPLRAAYLPMLAGAVASLEGDQRKLLGIPPGTPVRALRVQTRMLVAGMRLATGVSPSLSAARRRAAAVPTAIRAP
ncbi:MAG: DUF2236 domain-containing protein [Nitriliruptorales bacterium]|nr:DUF2236 domain-containing protein [Nitriliruptorales bacterium]